MIDFKDCLDSIKLIKKHFELAYNDELISPYFPENFELDKITKIQRNVFGKLYKKTRFYLENPLISSNIYLGEETKFIDMVLKYNMYDNLENIEEIIVREVIKMIIEKAKLKDSKASRLFFKSIFQESMLINIEFYEEINITGSLDEMINSFAKAICYTIYNSYDFYVNELGID